MIDFRADLHCHSTCSDGTLSPIELVKLAHTIGLKGLSITDHDTIEAYKTALPYAKTLNFPLVTGVEFSAIHRQTSVHILAYSFSPQSSIIQNFCQAHHSQREQRNQIILQLLANHQMPIEEQELHDPTLGFEQTIGRPHIAMAMIKRGYVSSLQEAFHKYIGEGKPCYAPGQYFSAEETVQRIHEANGLAVIAHPHLINRTKVIRDLLEMDFDGLEGYYSMFQEREQKKWVKIGQNKGWIVTGGSDFHGSIKPHLSLGRSWVNAETFQLLYERFLRNIDDL